MTGHRDARSDVDGAEIIRRLLDECREHDAEYHHVTNPHVIADAEAWLKETFPECNCAPPWPYDTRVPRQHAPTCPVVA